MKLTKVKPKYKNKFVIEVEFMHGDADAYTTEDFICDDEAECKSVMESLKGDIPMNPAEGGDENLYREWELKVFKSEDFIPYDTTGYDCPASYEGASAFFYDQNGEKFEVKF